MEFVHCGTLNQLFTLHGIIHGHVPNYQLSTWVLLIWKRHTSPLTYSVGHWGAPQVNIILNWGNGHLKSLYYVLLLLCSHQAFFRVWQQLGGSRSFSTRVVEVESLQSYEISINCSLLDPDRILTGCATAEERSPQPPHSCSRVSFTIMSKNFTTPPPPLCRVLQCFLKDEEQYRKWWLNPLGQLLYLLFC